MNAKKNDLALLPWHGTENLRHVDWGAQSFPLEDDPGPRHEGHSQMTISKALVPNIPEDTPLDLTFLSTACLDQSSPYCSFNLSWM